MTNDDFTPQEQALINRLQNAPQPRLTSSVNERIYARMMAELNSPTPLPTPAPTRPIIPYYLLAGVVGLGVRSR